MFADDIAEGDVIVCNDPYSGNTHAGDVVTACPTPIRAVTCSERHRAISRYRLVYSQAFPPPLKMYGEGLTCRRSSFTSVSHARTSSGPISGESTLPRLALR